VEATNWLRVAGDRNAKSVVCRLLRWGVDDGTSSGPYFASAELPASLIEAKPFSSSTCDAAETGKGVSRRPSPTEKHNEPMTTAIKTDDHRVALAERAGSFIASSI
jgi:hypothetical protein